MYTSELIANIQSLYKPKLNDDQIDFYMEYLEKFTFDQKKELWTLITENHCRMSPPTIGELQKYSVDVTPVKVVSNQFERPSLETIFNSELGQISLNQGWSDSYRIYCEENGLPDQKDDDFILRMQRSQENATIAINSIKDSCNPYDKILLDMWNTRNKKNKMQKQKYLRLN